MAKSQQYHVALSQDERKLIKHYYKASLKSTTRANRYKILLVSDENCQKTTMTYKEIAAKVGVSEPTVINTLKLFTKEGVEALDKIKRSNRSNVANLKVDGDLEAKIIAMACGPKPEGYAQWTLSLLEEYVAVLLEQDKSYDFDHLDRSTIGRALLRNQLRPHLNKYWCIPPENDAEFVARMEDVLDVYKRQYDPEYPVWCMDEKPYQLLDDARKPLPMRIGNIEKIDSEYVRDGTVAVFCFIQPHTGRIVQKVEETRTAVDWAEKIKYLVDVIAPDAKKITLVMDNLNTHSDASLYKTFPPADARRIARKLDIHYTPKHGSWLDIAEIGIHILTKQCLNRRIPSIEILRKELDAWESHYNQNSKPIDWQFTIEQARIKLHRVYPDIDKEKAARDSRRKEKQKA